MTIIAFLVVTISCERMMPKKQEINKTFSAKDMVNIETIGGDCIINTGHLDSITLKITYVYKPADSFQPEFIEDGNKLIIKEKLQGQSSGKSTWTLLVPNNTKINASSVSGGIQIGEMKSELNAKTISGNINVSNSEGSFILESVSGEITGSNLTGGFTVKNISGNQDFNDLEVIRESNWSTISGNNTISLKKGSEGDISISSFSGNSFLNYKGEPIIGSFEFTAEVDKGKIISPIQFTEESEFKKEEKRYYRKSFQKLKDTPKIIISTISGNVELREE